MKENRLQFFHDAGILFQNGLGISNALCIQLGRKIGIGDRNCLYYCFPQPVDGKIPPVAKARLAAEELYKTAMATRRQPPRSKNE